MENEDPEDTPKRFDLTGETSGYQGYLNRTRTELEEPDPLREHTGKWCNLFFTKSGKSIKGSCAYASEADAFDDAIVVTRKLKADPVQMAYVCDERKVVIVYNLNKFLADIPTGYVVYQLAWITQIPIKE